MARGLHNARDGWCHVTAQTISVFKDYAVEMEFCYRMDAVRLKNIWEWQFHYRNVIISFWHYSSCFTSSSLGEDELSHSRYFILLTYSFSSFCAVLLGIIQALALIWNNIFPLCRVVSQPPLIKCTVICLNRSVWYAFGPFHGIPLSLQALVC